MPEKTDRRSVEEVRKAIAVQLSTLATCVLEGEVSAFEVSLSEEGKFKLTARASAIGKAMLEGVDGPVS